MARLKRLARQEARLRYNPERRGLMELLMEAKGTRKSERKAARSTGRGLRAAIRAARPAAEENYDALDRRLAASDGTLQGGLVHKDLEGLGGAAGSIIAAALAEGASARDRAAGARTRRMEDLDEQRIRAREGQVTAIRQADQQYRADSSKILRQLAALDSDQGDYAATSLGRMRGERAGRRVQKRGQNMNRDVQRESRDAKFMEKYGVTYEQFKDMTPAQRRRAERRHEGKEKKQREWAPPATQGKAADSIGLALAQAKRLKKEDRTRAEAAVLLTEGREKIKAKVKDEKTGEMVDATIPEVPKYASLWASIALDIAYDGHISRRNAALLRKRGIRPRKLGYKLPAKPYEKRIRDNEVAGPPKPR